MTFIYAWSPLSQPMFVVWLHLYSYHISHTPKPLNTSQQLTYDTSCYPLMGFNAVCVSDKEIFRNHEDNLKFSHLNEHVIWNRKLNLFK